MKRNTLICLLLALLLCLLSGAAPAENEKAEGEPQGDLDSLFSWYYATGSLPDGASLRETSLRLNALHAKGSGADTAALENITGCSLDFVSGDEALKSAVLLTAEEAEAGHGLSVDIRIDNAALTSPGAAVFRLTLESASYRCVKDCTLRVLSPDESYRLPDQEAGGSVRNWFLADDDIRREGYFSIEDTANDLLENPDARKILEAYIPGLVKVMTEQNVIPLGLTLKSILSHDPDESLDAAELNKELNQIPNE